MEGGSNSKGTGLGGLFGTGGVGYSNADLSGVPLTGMSPLSPYLNLDPRYLVQDTDEFILPTGANKTRGRFELAFFTIGGCCMTGAAFGALNGLRLGLKETQNMAWSKPRNVQILNMVTRQGALWANTLGSLALLYSAFGVIIEKTRGAEDDLNTIAAGTLTGMLYKSTGNLNGTVDLKDQGLVLWSAWDSTRWYCRSDADWPLCSLQQLGAHEGLHSGAVPLSRAASTGQRTCLHSHHSNQFQDLSGAPSYFIYH
ncbi:putative mitochondrial import inner membrane translocase subunit Tim23B isoform X1 [Strigops habroptila]|uniref:putative mitochondrial import inner membrane translocase subunit Tim23B isoform X1 n=1 Tax=Strigops habroptila TaxID=2489341 RepID=UPI0011CFF849|nr:putative mitochondrial import inner membrane translocase subunit Tim23B isoform X1 [Strigops habroptila]